MGLPTSDRTPCALPAILFMLLGFFFPAQPPAGTSTPDSTEWAWTGGVPLIRITAPSEGGFDTPSPAVELVYADDDSDVDPSTIEIRVNGYPVEASCITDEKNAICTLAEILPEGLNTLSASVQDKAGNRSNSFEITITVDSHPQEVLLEPHGAVR